MSEIENNNKTKINNNNNKNGNNKDNNNNNNIHKTNNNNYYYREYLNLPKKVPLIHSPLCPLINKMMSFINNNVHTTRF
jgi:hypothetical protein